MANIFNSINTGDNNVFANINNNWLQYFLVVEKGFFVILSFLYIIFSIVVVRQVTSLSKNISGKFNVILTTISYINLIFSFFLVFLTLIILK